MEESLCELHSMFPGGLYKSVEQCGDEISDKDSKTHRTCYVMQTSPMTLDAWVKFQGNSRTTEGRGVSGKEI